MMRFALPALLLALAVGHLWAGEEGFTPLMYATGSTDQMRRLLAGGAEVNAASSSGATALLLAAVRGNWEGVRLLLAAGANPNAAMVLIPNSPVRVGLVQLAYAANDPELREILKEQGIRPELKSLMPIPGSSPFSGLFILSGFSMRPANATGMANGVSAILALGADPNADVRQLTRALPPLALAAQFSDAEAIRQLLAAGADPNRQGTQGVTPLMMAAAAEEPNPAVVRALLDAGARLDTRDALGRTALDWARMQGDSPAAALLKEVGGPGGSWAPVIAPAVAQPRAAWEAVTLALKQLQASAVEFHRQTKCISCHHQSLTAVAASIARKRGIPMDEELAAHPTRATLAMWSPSRESMLAGNCAVFGFLGNVSYGLFGMAEEGVAPNETTAAAAGCLMGLQRADGRWEGGDLRPPLAGRTPLLYTALAVRALRTYAPASATNAIAGARRYLLSTAATDSQGEAFRLMGLVWSGAGKEIGEQQKRVRALQGREGGWSQRAGMRPDAYATGQALYALHVAGVKPSDGALRKGAAFLLRTQTSAGSWFVPSRTLGFQPYVETGFPHGKDQFLSAAGTAWAAIALGLTL